MAQPQAKLARTRWLFILAVSVAWNVAALGWIGWRLNRPGDERATVPMAAATNDAVAVVSTVSPIAFEWQTNRFRWAQLESTNFLVYAANLRRVGCPERTLCDILLAEVDAHYEPRRRDIENDGGYWVAGRQRRALDRQRTERLRQLAEERLRLLQALKIPSDYRDEELERERFQIGAVMRFLVGPVTEEKFQKVIRIFSRGSKRESELRSQTGGVTTDEDDAALRQLVEEIRNEVKAVLSPLEYEEMTARLAVGTSQMVSADPKLLPLTAWELRQIVVLRTDGGRTWNFLEGDEEEEAKDPDRERRLREGLAAILGAAKAEEFERVQHVDYRQLAELTEKFQLPRKAAVSVYEMRRITTEELRAVREDGTLDEATRRQRLAEIQAAAQESVAEVLGEQAYQLYLSEGGRWVTNSSGL
jgi:hypothetical protein